ncbi:MAG: ribonuclease H-like domain-containing protein [Microscillaceae bacterium]|nr:ribonuclease H-like domain-containing protein [Microscillaceae bacterium]MDW8460333.1 ribonuclease H-like domain-containing protein [Cytophagales bacterium]
MLTFQQISSKVLFIDIETVRQKPTWHELNEMTQRLWERKAQSIGKADCTPAEKYEQLAAIYAEFGKIICVSMGFLYSKQNQIFFKLKSIFHREEAILLKELQTLLDAKFSCWLLCAHNGKEFDYPYLCRRFIVNQIPIPSILDLQNKKPWEIPHLDTLEMWKFGDKKAFTSLELLCHIFDIPTPKSDMSGADVNHIFWNENDLLKIARYCEKDVVATAQVLLKMNMLPLIPQENILSEL